MPFFSLYSLQILCQNLFGVETKKRVVCAGHRGALACGVLARGIIRGLLQRPAMLLEAEWWRRSDNLPHAEPSVA